ncbi:MAG: TetR/AcrR family transcriptional regulator [Geodermatophilaceae bacterium]
MRGSALRRGAGPRARRRVPAAGRQSWPPTARTPLAVRDLLVDSGYPALTMDAVAARARVGKGAIYRRYRSKAEVVIAALFYAESLVPDVHTGSLHGDLLAEAEGLLTVFRAPIALAALPYLLGELGDAEFQQRAQQRFITTDVERIEAILSNARDRGEVTGSADARLTCAVLLGVAFTWLYVFRWDVPEDLAQRLATFVVAALTS